MGSLNESQDSLIKRYEIFFAAENINISFTENAIKAIAKKAVQDKTGVRGLRSVLDKALLDVLFEIPTRQDIRECIVGPEVIEKSSPPILINQVGKPVVLKRNQIFISYSQKDLVWLDEFKTILSPMMRNKTIDVWFDRKIKPSQEWRKEIESALAATKVAVLLVSPNFLASDFVMSEEFPYLLNVAHTENVKLLWVLLGFCLYEETPLKDYQAAHNISKPLDSLSESERREVWVMISKHVKEAANAPLGAI